MGKIPCFPYLGINIRISRVRRHDSRYWGGGSDGWKESWYRNICKDVDIVIHVAWYAEPGKYLESDLNLECLSGTLKFAQAAAELDVEKFVGIGTCFEYDLTSTNLLDTHSPLNPQFLYSTSISLYFSIILFLIQTGYLNH